MIDAIRLENFKAVGTPQTVTIRPLTLIFGANNSGKSSILQAVLLLKQTLEEADSPRTTLLARGNLVDLHSLRMLRHRPAPQDATVGIAIRLSGQLPHQTGRANVPGIPPAPNTGLPNPWLSFQFAEHRQDDVLLEECVLGTADWANYLAKFANLALRGMGRTTSPRLAAKLSSGRWMQLSQINPEHDAVAVAWQRFVTAREAYSDAASGAWKDRGEKQSGSFHYAFSTDVAPRLLNLTFAEFLQAIVHQQSDPIQLNHFFPLSTGGMGKPTPSFSDPLSALGAFGLLEPTALLSRVAHRLKEMLTSKTEYTGPRRIASERYHVYSGSRPGRVGPAGLRTADLLFTEPEVLDRVNSWLTHFGLGAHIEVHRLDDGKTSSAFFLELVYPATGVRVQLPDMGSGLRQTLPVIVQVLASERKLLMIEEPESHLHPRLQGQLGDLFAESVYERQNQLIIETHSEHLVLRIQRLVRKGVLPADAVAIFFVGPSPDGALLQPLRLDGDGDFIDEWPEGFLPERLAELL